MGRFGIGALLLSAVLGYMTYTEGTLAFRSSDRPEEISLKDLIARGPDGNSHIVLSNFVLCDNFVHESEEGSKGSWKQVWVPIVPSEEVKRGDKTLLNPQNVKALFFSINIHNERELKTRLDKPRVQALVTNRIVSLESDVRKLLQQSYPATDFDRCLLIQEGRTPISRVGVYLLGGGSVTALILAVALFIGAFRRKQESGRRNTPSREYD